MKSKQSILIPNSSDKASLKKYIHTAIAGQKKRFDQHCKLLQEQTKLMKPPRPLSDKERQGMDSMLRRQFGPISGKKTPLFKPLKSHNPAVYAPFDYSSGFYDNSGAGVYDICELRGPNAQTGQIGANLSNGAANEYMSTDILSAHSSVGFLYFAQASGTLHITAQAIYRGRAASLNGNVYAGLQLSADHFIPSNQYIHTVTDIYRANVFSWLYPPDYVSSAITIAEFPEWEGRTLSLFRPVRRFQWYIISVSAAQHTIGYAQSDFDIYVAPVYYQLV